MAYAYDIFLRVSNPLGGISYEDLMNDVELFAEEKGLVEHTEILKKGALVAQDPGRFESVDLSEEEKEALRYEAAYKWKHPMKLYFTIIVCSIGAAVQGWDQTGSNGANLSFPVEFGIGHGEDEGHPNQVRDNWLVGLVNAGVSCSSEAPNCHRGGPLTAVSSLTSALLSSAAGFRTPLTVRSNRLPRKEVR